MEEAENDVDERATQAIVWLAGNLAKNRMFRFLPIGRGLHQLIKDCEKKPSALVVTIFSSIYKKLLVDPEIKALENSYEIPLSLDMNQFNCQNFLANDIIQEDKKEVLLSWIDGNLSKTQLIDLKKPQLLLPTLIKRCQQQPLTLVLPIIKEIGHYE